MKIAKLGGVADFIRGITFKPNDVVPIDTFGSVACLRTKNVQSELDMSDVWAVSSAFVKGSDRFAQEGDLVMSTANSWNLVGKVSWIPALSRKTTVGGFVCLVRPKQNIVDARYFYRWISSDRTQALLRSCARQTTNISNLSISQAEELEIPLPPLEEQKRIAAILDQADALRRLRTRALDRLNALGQAIFHEMFGDREYPKRMLKDVGRVTTGGTPPTAEDRYYGSDVPFMTPGDLNSGTAAKRYLSRSGADVVRTVDAGAALVCCIGATIGKMDMARATVAFNQQVNAVTWGSEVAPSYGLFALGIVRPEIERQGRGASTTLPILKKSSFEKIEIVLPPLDKQLSFSAKIDLLEGQTSRTRNELFVLDALFTSLQHRAFRGEL